MIQQFIYTIHCQLWNIEALKPNQLVHRISVCPFSGYQQQLMTLLLQAVHKFQSNRMIMKYIYIIDQLIKIPQFIPFIHNSFLYLYCDVYIFLLTHKHLKELQEFRILRKFWVGKLHPALLNDLKKQIYQRTHIDIDDGFKIDIINRIKSYYIHQLKLTEQQAKFHLPYLGKLKRQPSNVPAINQSKSLNSDKIDINDREDIKRKRFESQQTRISVNLNEEIENEPKPRKIIHLNEVIVDYKSMLYKLKQMTPYSCIQCGLPFYTISQHESHKKQHEKEKKKSYWNPILKKSLFKETKEWIRDNDRIYSNDEFCTPVLKQECCLKQCNFCRQEVQMQFRENRWIYVNAAMVKSNGEEAILHKSCEQALNNNLTVDQKEF